MTRVTSALLTAGLAAILVLVMTLGLSPQITARVVAGGELLWPGYAAELRPELSPPRCDPAAVTPPHVPSDLPAGSDPFGGADPFAGPATSPEKSAGSDPFGGADPFAAPTTSPEKSAGSDPFGGADPFGAAGSLAATPDGGACALAHERWSAREARLTPAVRVWRAVDLALGSLAGFPGWKHILVLFVGLGWWRSTAQGAALALAKPESKPAFMVSEALPLGVHLTWLASVLADWRVTSRSSAEGDNAELSLIWGVVFAGAALLHLSRLLRPPQGLRARAGFGEIAASVPLFAWLGGLAAGWFWLAEGYPSGQATYLHRFVQHPSVYLGLGLFLWAGMLLSRAAVVPKIFGVLRPLNLPPPLFAWLVVVLAAVPTAWSGASGIFVLAAGGLIFQQLREVGASRSLALGATAMSGSLGVVLAPCLVVVLIAMMNTQVTTADLFGWGKVVFALTSALLLVAMLAQLRGRWRVHPREALPEMGRAARGLASPTLTALLLALTLGFGLNLWLDEHTAPYLSPLFVVAWLVQATAKKQGFIQNFSKEVGEASAEVGVHAGAILPLMVASVAFGGVVERADLMALVPELSNPIAAMSLLVVAMVAVGMVMDAMGAVILVSVSLAHVAYRAGIAPVHFWMMVLVAFELGYLTPPVALNHLLARAVIGEEAALAGQDAVGWRRHEAVLLPLAVMGSALLIVAYLPFVFYP